MAKKKNNKEINSKKYAQSLDSMKEYVEQVIKLKQELKSLRKKKSPVSDGTESDKSKINNLKRKYKSNETFDVKKYAQFLNDIVKHIYQSRLRAGLSITKEVTLLQWRIGKELMKKSKEKQFGSRGVEKFSNDLQNKFPGKILFSRDNIYRMISFYSNYSKVFSLEMLEESALVIIPWEQNIILLEKLKDNKKRIWYAEQALENGWNKETLLMHIESDLFSNKKNK